MMSALQEDAPLPRERADRALAPYTKTEKAVVTATAQKMMLGAMKAGNFPANFLPPVPARPGRLPNVRVVEHMQSHQASCLQIRRPMSAAMATWVVEQFEAKSSLTLSAGRGCRIRTGGGTA